MYPRVHADAAGSGVVSQVGGVTLVETVRVCGLDRTLTEALAPWRKPLAVHDPAKVLLDLAITLAVGGDCLADVAVLPAEPGVYGRVASDPTVSRTIDALAADAPRALAAIGAARAQPRARPVSTPRTPRRAPTGRWSSTWTRRWSTPTATRNRPGQHSSAGTASTRCGPR